MYRANLAADMHYQKTQKHKGIDGQLSSQVEIISHPALPLGKIQSNPMIYTFINVHEIFFRINKL